MNIIIPAAGKSKRFAKAGIKISKCFLKIDNKMMIEHVIEMFDYQDKFHIIFNKDQIIINHKEINYLKKLSKNILIYSIENHDFGPVYSVQKLTNIPENEEIIVCYCDFKVEWNYKLFKRQIYGYDGAIPCFKNFHPASFGKTFYAYIKTDQFDNFLNLKEKQSFTKARHKEPASAGIYYFREMRIFSYYSNLLLKKLSFKQEAYVSLLYNYMHRDKLKTIITFVDKFICWGTVEDFLQYNYWSKYFSYKNINNSKFKHKQINLIPLAGRGKRFKKNRYRVVKPLITIQNDINYKNNI